MRSMNDTVERLALKDFSSLGSDETMTILAIRNQPEVRRGMYNDHEIGVDEHLRWMERLKTSDEAKMFGVIFDGNLVGAVGLTAMAGKHRRADWAFYLSSETQGKGIGSALEFKFLNMAFGEFELAKLNCEVLEFNKSVIAMHKKFGFVEEGVRRAHIERDGERISAVLLGMMREEWIARERELRERLFR